MSLSLLAYGVPLVGALKCLVVLNPNSWNEYDKQPESDHSSPVKGIVERVLNAVNKPESAYRDRVQELIQDLPGSDSSKGIPGVIEHRFKVIALDTATFPVHTAGTEVDDGDVKGKYFIAIPPNLSQASREVIPWLTAHEVCHILEEDILKRDVVTVLASLTAVVLTTYFCSWGLLPALAAAISTNIIAHCITTRLIEKGADDFANEHCSTEEKINAIAFFEKMKEGQKTNTIWLKILSAVLYPSEESRIANIRASMPNAHQESA